MAGVVVQDMVGEMGKAGEGAKIDKASEIGGRMMRRLGEETIWDGFHIMEIGEERAVPRILPLQTSHRAGSIPLPG